MSSPAPNMLSRLWRALGGGRPSPAARAHLLRICNGDERTLKRLVDDEMERRPGITEAMAYRRAIDRYVRDNS